MAKRKLYLAYGSNLNIRQMRSRCPEARIVGTAEIPDYQLLFKGSKTGAYLTIESKDGASVPVCVWSVTADDEAMLDVYEGFPEFYYKAEMEVEIRYTWSRKNRSPKHQNAFVYIMHENRPLGRPSQSYVKTCMAGYLRFGFDTNLLREAIQMSTEGSEQG